MMRQPHIPCFNIRNSERWSIPWADVTRVFRHLLLLPKAWCEARLQHTHEKTACERNKNFQYQLEDGREFYADIFVGDPIIALYL